MKITRICSRNIQSKEPTVLQTRNAGWGCWVHPWRSQGGCALLACCTYTTYMHDSHQQERTKKRGARKRWATGKTPKIEAQKRYKATEQLASPSLDRFASGPLLPCSPPMLAPSGIQESRDMPHPASMSALLCNNTKSCQ